MIENADQNTVVSKKQRLKAVGDELDFLDDPMMTYMTKHVEDIFEPKRILNDEDWLKKNRE